MFAVVAYDIFINPTIGYNVTTVTRENLMCKECHIGSYMIICSECGPDNKTVQAAEFYEVRK